MNTIQEFQQKACGKADSALTIHLNASDERGIDIIRNQISAFVSSCPFLWWYEICYFRRSRLYD